MTTVPLCHMRRAVGVGLTVLCALAAGCGDDKPTDAEQIASVLETKATSKSVKVQCETTITGRFIREVYGDLEQCRKASKPEADDPKVEAKVAQTRIKADKATTALTLDVEGRDSDVTGRVALVKVDEKWKLDRFGLEFLQSFTANLGSVSTGVRGGRQTRCLARVSRKLSSRTFRSVINALVGERLAEAQLPNAVTECLIGRPTTTFGREQFEKAIEQGLEDENVPSATIKCVKRRLRITVSDAEVAKLAEGTSPPALQRKTTRALARC